MNVVNPILESRFGVYGTIYHESLTDTTLVRQKLTISAQTITEMFCFPYEVSLEVTEGVALILVGSSPTPEHLQTFPVRSHIRLKPNVCFHFLALSDRVAYELFAPEAIQPMVSLPIPYRFQRAAVPFPVSRILDCYYRNETQSYTFYKPSHTFCELLYVHNGTLQIEIADTPYTLQTHDAILYCPQRDVKIQTSQSCGYVNAIFELDNLNCCEILEQIFHCTSELQQVLWKLLIESSAHTRHTQTLLLCYLQEAITLFTQLQEASHRKQLTSDTLQNFHDDLLCDILSYMHERITEPITIEEICHEFFMSRSSLQALFKIHLHNSPKNYLINIKLQKSKEMIRKNQHTISEIAYLLGFSSIHYFSRLFKKYFQITPSEYAKKIAQTQQTDSSDGFQDAD